MSEGSRLKHEIMLHVERLAENCEFHRASELFKEVDKAYTGLVMQKMSAVEYIALLEDIETKIAIERNNEKASASAREESKKGEIGVFTRKETNGKNEKAGASAREESKKREIGVFTQKEENMYEIIVDSFEGAVRPKMSAEIVREIGVFTRKENSSRDNEKANALAGEESKRLIEKNTAIGCEKAEAKDVGREIGVFTRKENKKDISTDKFKGLKVPEMSKVKKESETEIEEYQTKLEKEKFERELTVEKQSKEENETKIREAEERFKKVEESLTSKSLESEESRTIIGDVNEKISILNKEPISEQKRRENFETEANKVFEAEEQMMMINESTVGVQWAQSGGRLGPFNAHCIKLEKRKDVLSYDMREIAESQQQLEVALGYHSQHGEVGESKGLMVEVGASLTISTSTQTKKSSSGNSSSTPQISSTRSSMKISSMPVNWKERRK